MMFNARKPNRKPVMVRVLVPARGSKPTIEFVQGEWLGDELVAQPVNQARCRCCAISINPGLIQPDYRQDQCIGAGVKLTQAIDAARVGTPHECLGLDPLTGGQREILRGAERAIPRRDSVDRRECRHQIGFENEQLADEAAQLRFGKPSQFPLEQLSPSIDAGEDHRPCCVVRDVSPSEHDNVAAKAGEYRLQRPTFDRQPQPPATVGTQPAIHVETAQRPRLGWFVVAEQNQAVLVGRIELGVQLQRVC